jgi:hypothetical protein
LKRRGLWRRVWRRVDAVSKLRLRCVMGMLRRLSTGGVSLGPRRS